MTFADLQNIFITNWLAPWEHDYYMATFNEPKNQQEFLDYSYTTIENLDGIWYEVVGNSVYFIVKKGTIIPEDFADHIEAIVEVPEQPIEEGTE